VHTCHDVVGVYTNPWASRALHILNIQEEHEAVFSALGDANHNHMAFIRGTAHI